MLKWIIKPGKIVAGITAVSGLVGLAAFVEERLDKTQRSHRPFGFYEEYVKRPLDAFLSTGAFIVFSPVFITTSVLVRFKLGTPVFFRQERPGRDEKIFRMFKFRTMTDKRDENGQLLPDEERLTAFGKKLRAASLDELPELLNIIKGDMAVVGPRPLIVEYLPYYTEKEHHRHDVRPGLTGYAQVHGRNYVTWEDKFDMDLEYSERITFAQDARIILETAGLVAKRENVETASSIVHDGVLYQPLNVERGGGKKEDKENGE